MRKPTRCESLPADLAAGVDEGYVAAGAEITDQVGALGASTRLTCSGYPDRRERLRTGSRAAQHARPGAWTCSARKPTSPDKST